MECVRNADGDLTFTPIDVDPVVDVVDFVAPLGEGVVPSMENVVGGIGPSANLVEPEGACGGLEFYSRKVFLGGLPQDITEEEIRSHFQFYGRLLVDWPSKNVVGHAFPPGRFAFLIFENESAVHRLIDWGCAKVNGKFYHAASSVSKNNNWAEIRPWMLSNAVAIKVPEVEIDSKRAIFVGGIPREVTAAELATMISNLFGEVCSANIFLDEELKYPKGSGRIVFSDDQSYRSALSAGNFFIMDRLIGLKPYVNGDQQCGVCHGLKCNETFAKLFCSDLECLRYYCLTCWAEVHITREHCKPLVWGGNGF